MIEGVLRHCTDMEIQRHFVDSHGQSEVAFAFCHLLNFELAPRLRQQPHQFLARRLIGDVAQQAAQAFDPRLKLFRVIHAGLTPGRAERRHRIFSSVSA